MPDTIIPNPILRSAWQDYIDGPVYTDHTGIRADRATPFETVYTLKPFEIRVDEQHGDATFVERYMAEYLDQVSNQYFESLLARHHHIPRSDNAWMIDPVHYHYRAINLPTPKYHITLALNNEVQEPVIRRSRYELLLDPNTAF